MGPQSSTQPQSEPLGEALDIRQVAALLGCSVWTVRQKYIPMGLPFFRLVRAGKLTFYRNQILAWILNRQQQNLNGGLMR